MNGNEEFISKLSTTTGVNMQTAGGAQTLHTGKHGKTTHISKVVIRNVSATLAGGTDYDFTGFRQNVDLSSMTSPSGKSRELIPTDNTDYTELAEDIAFQITPTTGSTGAATAVIEVWGYEY